MNVDHFFSIGQTHVKEGVPCEDYAASGILPGLAFGAVADGCSGAHARTDIGARVIVTAFERSMRLLSPSDSTAWFDTDMMQRLEMEFSRTRITDGLDDYFATLVAFIANRDTAKIMVFGDGGYILRYRDGSKKIVWFEWRGNAPYYMAYRLDEAAGKKYIDEFLKEDGDQLVIENWITFRDIESGSTEIIDSGTKQHPFSAFSAGYVCEIQHREQAIEAIAVVSDGVATFKGAALHDVVKRLMAFKTTAGAFVKRRCIRILSESTKENHLPADDFSISCVWFPN